MFGVGLPLIGLDRVDVRARRELPRDTAISRGPEQPIIPVDVDLVGLIERVYVAPDAPEWITSVVDNVTRRYGFEFPVLQWDLATDPIA
ncbi:hypothetical protein [Microbacterium sp. NPDC076911]|uniref:hypothetical protein n=1 Tax=Microbacterium sp. NPDC076911 TaxID=3154958 RepID=UPI003427292A